MSSGTADALGLSRAILCNGECPHSSSQGEGIVVPKPSWVPPARPRPLGPMVASVSQSGTPACPSSRLGAGKRLACGHQALTLLGSGLSVKRGAGLGGPQSGGQAGRRRRSSHRETAQQGGPSWCLCHRPSCSHRTKLSAPVPPSPPSLARPLLPPGGGAAALSEPPRRPCPGWRQLLEGERRVRAHSPHTRVHTLPGWPAGRLDPSLPSSPECKQQQLGWTWEI